MPKPPPELQNPGRTRQRNHSDALNLSFSLPSHLFQVARHVELLPESEEVSEWEFRPSISGASISDFTIDSTPYGRFSELSRQSTTQDNLEHGPNREEVATLYPSTCINKHISEQRHPPSSSIVHREPELHRPVSYDSNSSGARSISHFIPVHHDETRRDSLPFWSTKDPFSLDNIEKSRQMPTQSHRESNGASNLALIDSDATSLVPESIQRRFTNASHIRKSSIWKTYQKAKYKAIKVQRNKQTQLIFEYSVYLTLAAFVYFVLVGVPLWKGAVYWLWWVVAHRFVIAGGSSITLGIAFL